MEHSPDYIIDANGVSYRVLRDQLGSPLLIVNASNLSDVMLNAKYSGVWTPYRDERCSRYSDAWVRG